MAEPATRQGGVPFVDLGPMHEQARADIDAAMAATIRA